jgi:hypothetical protein
VENGENKRVGSPEEGKLKFLRRASDFEKKKIVGWPLFLIPWMRKS